MRRILCCVSGPSDHGASNAESPDPSSGVRRLLGGMQGLPGRRSSGAPAPRSRLESLHNDTLGLITAALSRRPGLDASRDVFNLSRTSKALQASVATDVHARRQLMRGPVLDIAQELICRFLGNTTSAWKSRLCIPVLSLLDPSQQARLVGIQLNPASVGSDGLTRSREAFRNFVPQLAHLDKPLRAELAVRASGCNDDEAAATAVGGLGGGLAHLDEPSIELLVNKATRLQEEMWRARAIHDLSAGLAHMNADLRQRMRQAAMGMQDPDRLGLAIAGLCAELKHLPPEQHGLLFEQALSLPLSSWGRALALAGLAASVEVLNEEQKETLLTQTLSLPNDAAGNYRARAVAAFAAGVAHLDPEQCRRLVDSILALRSDKAMAALGPGIERVAPDQQDRLLEVLAGLDDNHKAAAIAGLAAGWLPRKGSRPDSMVALVLAMDSRISMAEAIGALGPHLKHLKADRLDAVVEQALCLLGDKAVSRNFNHKAIHALTAGLGAGMQALREEQQDALVSAVAAMAPSNAVDKCDSLFAIAAAIAGLASGQQHLSEPQFKTLIEATGRLKAIVAHANIDYGIRDQINAMAYFGLALRSPR